MVTFTISPNSPNYSLALITVSVPVRPPMKSLGLYLAENTLTKPFPKISV